MKKVRLIFVTLGRRDLSIDDNNEDKPPREKGRYILDNYNTLKHKLSLNILEEFLSNELSKESDKKKLFIFATNQEDPNFNKDDTIFYAKVIEKLLYEKYNKNKNLFIEIIEIKENLEHSDLLYDFFKKTLNNKISKIEKEYEIENVSCALKGGIPDVNYSILLYLIFKFKTKLKHFNIKEEKNRKKSFNFYPLKFSNEIWRDIEREKVLEYIDSFNYLEIKKNSSIFDVQKLAETAFNLFSFNLDEAKRVREYEIKDRDFVSEILKYLEQIEEDEKNILRELYFTIWIYIQKKYFADALARLYNFTERIFLFELSKITKEEKIFEDIIKKWDSIIEELIKKYPEIAEKKDNYDKIDVNEYSIPTLSKILSIIKKDESEFLEILKQLEKIRQIRNKSIVAHGTTGISEEKLKERLENTHIIEILKNIEKYYDFNFENSLYTKINNKIKSLYEIK